MTHVESTIDEELTSLISDVDARSFLEIFESLKEDDIKYIVDTYKEKSAYCCDSVPPDRYHQYPPGLYVAKYTQEAEIKDDITFMDKLQDPTDSNIIIWNEIDGKFYHFRDSEKLLSYLLAIPVSERTYHERIYKNQPQKLRLDLDYKYGIDGDRIEKFTDDDLDIVHDVVISVLSTLFKASVFVGNRKILFCTSTGEKFSHHIVIDGLFTRSYLVVKKFAEIVKDRLIKQGHTELGKSIDLQIYKKAAGLRLPFNHKKESDRIKLLPIGTKFESALITNVSCCEEIFIKDDVPLANNLNQDQNINITPVDTQLILDAINDYNPLILDGFRFRNTVNRYLNFNRMKATHCVFCKEVHHVDNTIFVMIDNGFVRIRCRHNDFEYVSVPIVINTVIPEVKKTTLAKMIEKRMKTEYRIKRPARNMIDDNLENINYMTLEVYDGQFDAMRGDSMNEYPDDIDTIFVKAPMGCGKTRALVRYMLRNNIESVLAGSHRVTLSTKFAKDMGLDSYDNIQGTISPDEHPRVVVQNESMCRLAAKKYRLFVVDEVESILAQCFSPTHRDAHGSWAKFQYMMKYCDKVICMDANLKESTVKLINEMRAGKSSKLIINKALPKPTTHHITTIKPIAISKLLNFILVGKKVVVPTSSKQTAEQLRELILKKFPLTRIKMYTSSTDQVEKKRDIADIENTWTQCDVLIYTPTIQAGVSFTSKHFDACVCFWYNTSTDVYSCLQMMMRVRDIADSDYTHYIKERLGDRPDTPERVLKFASESCENLAKCMGINLNYDINEDGTIVIKDDNYRTRAWLQHVSNQNASKNNFLEILKYELRKLNGTIMAEPSATKELIKMGRGVNKQLKMINIELKTAEFQKIINCRDITTEQYKEFKDRDGLNEDEALLVKRHLIRRFFSLPDDKAIDMKFLETYWNNQTRSIYVHRKNVADFDGVRAAVDGVAPIIIGSFFYGSSTEQFNKLFNVSRDKHCLEFLDMFGFNFNNPAKTLTREELLAILHNNHDKIIEKYHDVRKLFDCDGISKPPEKTNEKYVLDMLRHINGKLKVQYGISIKAIDTHNTNYKIKDMFATLFDANFQPIQ